MTAIQTEHSMEQRVRDVVGQELSFLARRQDNLNPDTLDVVASRILSRVRIDSVSQRAQNLLSELRGRYAGLRAAASVEPPSPSNWYSYALGLVAQTALADSEQASAAKELLPYMGIRLNAASSPGSG